MFIFAFALALIHPADACAMPRMEQVAVAPVVPGPNAKPEVKAPASLEQALADIDSAGIPELQNAAAAAPVAPVAIPAPAAKNRAAAAEDAPPLGSAPPQS